VSVKKGECFSFNPTHDCFLGGAEELEKPRRGKYNRQRDENCECGEGEE
jgi:hypothetical protein